jgi:hypothetical protein
MVFACHLKSRGYFAWRYDMTKSGLVHLRFPEHAVELTLATDFHGLDS